MVLDKYEELRTIINKDIAKEEHHPPKRMDSNSHLKTERKKIAQSILSNQKLNSLSFGHQKSEELLRPSNPRGSR